MADTFETMQFSNTLETFEWDNVWLEHTENKTAKRVLYIGDSISCGTRRFATEQAKGAFLFDGFGTSKALDNPFFKEALDVFMRQQSRCDVVLFNNGHHGFHLDDAAYEAGYRQMILFLKEKTYAPLYLLLSTCAADGEKDACMRARNSIVRRLAAEYGCPVIDLYTVTDENRDLQLGDGVHFSTEGYRKLAECIVETLQN